jgi:hypothetical protein
MNQPSSPPERTHRLRNLWLPDRAFKLPGLPSKLRPDPPPIPYELRYVKLYGIEYCIMWENMQIGDSVFLKTTADYKTLAPTLRKANAYFNRQFEARPRCEDGYFGLRIWRLA